MNKNSPSYHDEIDLIELFRTIWLSKIKIVLITIISFLIGWGYSNKIPNSFTSSLIINPGKISEYSKLETIYTQLGYQIIPKNIKNQANHRMLKTFIDELMDYEELILVIRDNEKIKESISKLSAGEQRQELFNYAKSFTLKSDLDYTLSFNWHNSKQSKDIIEQTLDLTVANLEKSIYKDLEYKLDIENKKAINRNQERIVYLSEQSSIARELDILDNQVDNVNLAQSTLALNINTNDVAYYLRGYRAIEKEIELIKNREYKNFAEIKKKINILKEMKINWIDYNIYLINVKSNKNVKNILLKSILIGIIVGILYVLISNAFRSPRVFRKKTN
tara:strand:+ start:4608 stop:5609 length:1002 start_codon:yes stop_codon:yes gene_type:complete